jgi:hypothetical protein
VSRPRLEVADVLRAHGEEYCHRHPASAAQLSVIRHIEQCRTAALGGHIDTCTDCGKTLGNSYNSCRDRHCPKCQGLKKAQWLDERLAHLLPIPYWHVTFTIPDTLNPVALRNKQAVFNILFDAAAQTLQEIARDPKHLGAEVGFTAVLHTWGQNLLFHPHIHCVVTGGGLDPDGTHWIATSPKFFLPVRVLGSRFRSRFLDALDLARRDDKLDLSGSTEPLAEPPAWRRFLRQLRRVNWVVDARAPFAGPEQVYRYLSHYTQRIAISNHRLVAMEGRRISFTAKDYRNNARRITLSLDGVEFIRRFLLHVLPKKFVRIRHYGLLAGRSVSTKLVLARSLIPSATVEVAPSRIKTKPKWWEQLFALTGIDVFRCPFCKSGHLVRRLLSPEFHTAVARSP